MGARSDASLSAPNRSPGPRTPSLALALRTAAARAAEMAGGGLSLIFTTAEPVRGGSISLRAAAGFATVDAARAAAAAAEALAAETIRSGEPRTEEPEVSLGEKAIAGLSSFPLRCDSRVWGALVVGSAKALAEDSRDAILSLAGEVALRLDRAELARRVAQLEEQLDARDQEEEQKSDEILKLSEALFAQDIELLRNTEELGKVEKLKSDFIEKMSRELRTPLNSIIECIISVLAGENENLSASAREALRAALDDGTSFLRTLQNILDLWRIKQGELPVESQEVNFREVVDEAIFSVQDTLGDKPVAIEKEIVEPLPKIRTDLAKVNQILFLLLDNAAKFTHEGRIVIGVTVQGDRLRCSITDTGIGICNDDRDYVFDEFFQVDEAASSRYRGAGLGLTLVRDLLALLDGEIALSSEVGQGTRVVFEVPVQVTR